MTDKLLADRFKAAARPLDDSDWSDVRRRAAEHTRTRVAKRRFGRPQAAIAAAVACALVLTGAALALGTELFDFVIGDPAPESVQERLNDDRPTYKFLQIGDRRIAIPVYESGPSKSGVKARLLGTTQTAALGPAYIWGARFPDGWCWFHELPALQRGERSSSSYDNRPECEDDLAGSSSEFRWRSSGMGTPKGSAHLLYGLAPDRVESASVVLWDGSVRELPLHESFFLVELPLDGQVREFIGRDVAGRVIVRTRGFPQRGALRLPVPPTSGEPLSGLPLTGPAKLAGRYRTSAGREIQLWVGPTREGWCYSRRTLRRDGALSSAGTSCNAEQSFRGLREEDTLASGDYLLIARIRPEVLSLEFRLTNGSKRRLPVVDGFYLLGLPSRLGTVGAPVGRDAVGRIVPLGS